MNAVPTVRLERGGLYGAVGVVDTSAARRFTIRGVLQGASLLEPPAASVDSSLPQGPGPVVETRYQLAWFLAAQRHVGGRGLMLGFGGGCGAVGLLHEFPQFCLDGVEADPAMATMAREFHPLVRHYEREGRLRLTVADAEDYLAQAGSDYDFAIADLAVDGDSVGALNSSSLIRSIAGAAREIWFRVFASVPDGEIEPFLDKFEESGAPVDWLVSPVSVAAPVPRTRDWILAAGVPSLPGPDSFEPYAGIKGSKVAEIREAYRRLAGRAIPAAEARRMAAAG